MNQWDAMAEFLEKSGHPGWAEMARREAGRARFAGHFGRPRGDRARPGTQQQVSGSGFLEDELVIERPATE